MHQTRSKVMEKIVSNYTNCVYVTPFDLEKRICPHDGTLKITFSDRDLTTGRGRLNNGLYKRGIEDFLAVLEASQMFPEIVFVGCRAEGYLIDDKPHSQAKALYDLFVQNLAITYPRSLMRFIEAEERKMASTVKRIWEEYMQEGALFPTHAWALASKPFIGRFNDERKKCQMERLISTHNAEGFLLMSKRLNEQELAQEYRRCNYDALLAEETCRQLQTFRPIR